MVTTLDDTKRMMLGERLADLRRFQAFIISNDQKLIDGCPDQDIRDRLQTMLEDDQKNLGKLYDEQAEMKQMLDEIKAIDPNLADLFRSRIKELMNIVGDHIRQEESTLFAAIDKNCSTQQKEQMASEFKVAKSKIQQAMSASV